MNKLKDWPDKQDEIVDYEDLIAPLEKAALAWIEDKIPFEYAGFKLPKSAEHVRYAYEDLLSENYNLLCLEQVIQIAYELGFENGVRYERKESGSLEIMCKVTELLEKENGTNG